MPNINTFDEASAATQEMFADNEQLSLADAPLAQENAEVNPEIQEATPAWAEEMLANDEALALAEEQTAQPEQEAAAADEAVNIAEIAAQTAQEKDAQLRQALDELEALKAQNRSMQGTIEELSARNEEKLIEEAMQMPTLDINGLAFADVETIANAQAEYAQKMAEYVKGDIMREVSPLVQQAKEGIYQKEKADALEVLAQVPELAGIGDMLPQLDRIIANNKWLQSDDMPMDEKYINAFAIAKGVNSINTPPAAPPEEPTTEELLAMYNSNPAFQELVEKQRLEALKQSQQVPPFSASSGAVNAALNIKDKPQTLEEASERTRQMFGM